MRDYSLRLLDDTRDERIDLALHPAGEEQPLSYLLEGAKARVLARGRYYAQIVSPRTNDIRYLEVQINHYPVDVNFYPETGHVYFGQAGHGRTIFIDSFGLARLTLRFRDSEGMHILHSDYVEVVVPNTDEYFSVNEMGKYIASHNKMLFYGTRADYFKRSGRREQSHYSLEDKIRMLKQTAAVLEGSWRLIRMNPRKSSRTSSGAAPESVSESVRFLLTHPEALQPSRGSSGILLGNKRYVPDFSKFQRTVTSTDVYENQVTLSFLRAVCADISAMIPALEQVAADLPVRPAVNDNDVYSASFMLNATRNSLHSTAYDLKDLLAEYTHLLSVYTAAIPATTFELKSVPKATPSFLSLPGYHQIFESIHRWFMMQEVTVRDVRFVRTFLQITETYEVYVLTKLAQFLVDYGFELTSANQIEYAFETYSLYKNTEINNVFKFERDDLTITLFYQPVLYDPSSPQAVLTGLVRSTSLSMPMRGMSEPSHGRYYTPDYVFKIESTKWKGARYILGDAKYTNRHSVRDFKMFPLIFKYLFSISPMNPDDQITGLYVFNGKSENPSDRMNLLHSIYDLVGEPHHIFPQVETVSLYEYPGASQENQFKQLQLLFDIQIEKARSVFEHTQRSILPHMELFQGDGLINLIPTAAMRALFDSMSAPAASDEEDLDYFDTPMSDPIPADNIADPNVQTVPEEGIEADIEDARVFDGVSQTESSDALSKDDASSSLDQMQSAADEQCPDSGMSSKLSCEKTDADSLSVFEAESESAVSAGLSELESTGDAVQSESEAATDLHMDSFSS